MKRSNYIQFIGICLIGFLIVIGCTTTNTKGIDALGETKKEETIEYKPLDKHVIDTIINQKLDREQAIKYLKHISIKEYDIADLNTAWCHSAIGGSRSEYSIYQFQYKKKYYILFLKGKDTDHLNCIDIEMIPIVKTDYELLMGSVEIDGKMSTDIITIYNKKWVDNTTTDISVAFLPNIQTGKIERLRYKTIKKYIEE